MTMLSDSFQPKLSTLSLAFYFTINRITTFGYLPKVRTAVRNIMIRFLNLHPLDAWRFTTFSIDCLQQVIGAFETAILKIGLLSVRSGWETGVTRMAKSRIHRGYAILTRSV